MTHGKEGIPDLDPLALARRGVLIQVEEVGVGALLLGVHLPVAIVADEGTARGVDEAVQPVLESLPTQEIGLDPQPVGVEVEERGQLGGDLPHDLVGSDAGLELGGVEGLVTDEEAQGGGVVAEVGIGPLVDLTEALGVLLEVVEDEIVDVDEGLHAVLVHLIQKRGHKSRVVVTVTEGGRLVAGDAAVGPAGNVADGGGGDGGVVPESDGVHGHDGISFLSVI